MVLSPILANHPIHLTTAAEQVQQPVHVNRVVGHMHAIVIAIGKGPYVERFLQGTFRLAEHLKCFACTLWRSISNAQPNGRTTQRKDDTLCTLACIICSKIETHACAYAVAPTHARAHTHKLKHKHSPSLTRSLSLALSQPLEPTQTLYHRTMCLSVKGRGGC